jgi:hypothetical protein
MSRKTNRALGTLAAVLIAATLAPSVSLAYHDLRSQDALDAARSLPLEQLVAVSEALRKGAAQEPTSGRVGESDRFGWPSAVIARSACSG